jgi:hypothetical protein
VIEHRLQAVTTHIALTRAVYRVAELHVVSRHGLGDSPGRASNLEKPAGGFLTGTDFRNCAVFSAVEINSQCFLVRIENRLFHRLISLFFLRF